MPTSVYRAQKRGGRGVNAQNLKDEDYVKNLYVASTHDLLLFFSNTGRLHRRKGYQIPEAGRTARGTAIVNVLPLDPEEKITAVVLTRDMDEDAYLVMVTKNGTVKRIAMETLHTNRKGGIRALTLDEGDELISVLKTTGNDRIILATRQGMAICFDENDVRPMGREAAGVRGIKLMEDDCVVGANVATEGKELLTVTERGFGKRTKLVEYRTQTRGGKGMRNYGLTEKSGLVAAAQVVDENDDIMLIENSGVIIRMAASDINVYGRAAKGVIVMRVEEGNRVIALQRTDKEEAEAEETEEAIEE